MKLLVVTAHPDDECLFFGGLLLERARQGWETEVFCVTNTGKSRREQQRRRELKSAARALGVKKIYFGGLVDEYRKRLDPKKIVAALAEQLASSPDEVFTHGTLGEYGHPHHQDVSWAVLNYFRGPVFGVAHHIAGDLQLNLSPQQVEIKTRVLTETYGEEFFRFFNVLPARDQESFYLMDRPEAETLYQHIAHRKKLALRHLRRHAPLVPLLKKLPRNFKYFLVSYFQVPLSRIKLPS